MWTERRIYLDLEILALCLLVGCASPSVSSPSSAGGFTGTPIVTRTVQPTQTETFTPTIESTSLPVSTPTDIASPSPTLTLNQVASLIVGIVTNNGGCELPCFWGGHLSPGKTTVQEANQLLISLGQAATVSDGSMGIDIPAPPSTSFSYTAFMQLSQMDNHIQIIEFYGTSNGVRSSQFTKDWRAHYSWTSVMSQMGPPEHIEVAFYPAADPYPAYYNLLLAYDSLGMAIWYFGFAQDMSRGLVRICPKFEDITEVHLILYDPSSKSALPKKLFPSGELFDLDEATGMSVEAFCKTFKSPNGHACIENH